MIQSTNINSEQCADPQPYTSKLSRNCHRYGHENFVFYLIHQFPPSLFQAPTFSPIASLVVYEAELESFDSSSKVDTNHSPSGTGHVNMGPAGSWLEFDVYAGSGGTCTLAFLYANGRSSNRPCSVSVNGSNLGILLTFPSTGGWPNWQYETIEVACAPGSNSIRITDTVAAGGPNVDRLDVSVDTGTDAPTAQLTDSPTGKPTLEVRLASR